MGCHLRFGFEATYARDTIRMRDDNIADYPWLCFAVAGAMDEYVRMAEAGETGPARDVVVEALLNGLTPDARAFVGAPITTLKAHEAERLRARDQLLAYRGQLREEFEAFRPTSQAYSPLSFFFNFSHNVLKGTVVDALLRREVWPVSLNGLFTSLPADPDVSEQKTPAGGHVDGLRPLEPPDHPRPSDAGDRLRPVDRPRSLRQHDAETDGIAETASPLVGGLPPATIPSVGVWHRWHESCAK